MKPYQILDCVHTFKVPFYFTVALIQCNYQKLNPSRINENIARLKPSTACNFVSCTICKSMRDLSNVTTRTRIFHANVLQQYQISLMKYMHRI